ncbi:patatin-like phospholipase family protein [uncultured Piscinibacter sp.]|uniref:patatin-like phospholipase family protein n=1 Tax=uncultured Piscinibacter sp. TaxID=1131835 RepID=UPI0026332B25|nr:patatin-like phospholipase family protein [uncultured Piscinibacter sp.]
MDLTRRTLTLATAAALPAALFAGCASRPAWPPIPAELVDAAQVPGHPNVRQFGDRSGRDAADLWGTGPNASFGKSDAIAASGPLRVLAISGGGSNGAFAAGVLAGWSESGTRPEFHIVTGVSAGALAAPYAFLGPRFDVRMRELFTGLSSRNIMKPRPRLLAIFDDALASAEPLRQLIERNFDMELMGAVAREHQRGRRLFVGTTHVYAGRLVTWDIGAIAVSGQPDSLDLIRRVLLASAAIPIMLPPVYIEVEANGRRFHEMHVDGSMTRQIFVSAPDLDWGEAMRAHRHHGEPEFYAIRNGRATSEYMVMPPELAALGEHALHLLAQSQGVADLYVIYVQAQRARARYRAAWIGDEFVAPWELWYDPQYVQALFDYGRSGAASGAVWRTVPPGIDVPAPGPRP